LSTGFKDRDLAIIELKKWDAVVGRLGTSREAIEVVKLPGRHANMDNGARDKGRGRRPEEDYEEQKKSNRDIAQNSAQKRAPNFLSMIFTIHLEFLQFPLRS